jgi:hypothetical protein
MKTEEALYCAYYNPLYVSMSYHAIILHSNCMDTADANSVGKYQ